MVKRNLVVPGVLGLVLVVAVMGVLGYASGQPLDQPLTRSTTVSAPPAVVFAQVDDLSSWEQWSPGQALDPTMEIELGPKQRGAGARDSGSSEAMGAGGLRIVESTAPTAITTAIDLGEHGTGTGTWALVPGDDRVDVAWSFTSHGRHLSDQVFQVLFLEPMLGPQLEAGLDALKAAAGAG